MRSPNSGNEVALVCINTDTNGAFQIGQYIANLPSMANDDYIIVFVCVCLNLGNPNLVDKAMICLTNRTSGKLCCHKKYVSFYSVAVTSLWKTPEICEWVSMEMKNTITEAMLITLRKWLLYIMFIRLYTNNSFVFILSAY